MSKVFLVAFVMIAGVAVAGVDYVNQARAAGQPSGTFGIADYVGTISGRIGGGGDGDESETTVTAEPVNRIGASNCIQSGGVKRCSIGGT